ncbi:hypothetical protein A2962_00575 [Candidatus Woesebacteria bacterium RIFCSPLOWO2_01_FULL_39_61]|uniref:Steroid 5-alpha reductase C-terminal domain-containing protein n=1 Tax=Candidatus Woesebacteria bacterium RIFCSPHIGHO2_02_FULL_39_13 TaxID=1802505 RepID=A0A1F7Z243_9BACT|nr:MAG: hypothetical protein A2692_04705 [Candidatus Woesebacteria bacterium RIFCSPHIGHO2_01_FULL_39_95]OGM33597.1 MAG: hypothetical protein A3D01_01420 [Candidatus Woesebacteria bacterium RIFCSPHIGHO2_02_FULL_39_13]OGM36673.1 MAG: hypothetical protein A3E13_00070 [Candidatus Woesebacteria bacterium RIFCSPHIGHO2_12_FULL_40_20]OGM68546.1 MAG: hypothetical protein A2962_00575 [Candidatus Woesebacteria bacterium RIFCSPLOWO2_01_FULL_39_61]OGM73435.1 MAG: hypothetical protein A3H19_00765 [Candidatus
MKVKTILMAIVYAGGLWIFLPYLFILLNDFFGLPRFTYLPLRVLGVLIIICVLLTDLYLFNLFKFFGKGTPVPVEPTNKLIHKGPYKYVRNPMYVGHSLIFLGEFLLFGYPTILLYIVSAGMGFHLLVVKWEEPQLVRRLGEPYENYLNKVPRWLPKILI